MKFIKYYVNIIRIFLLILLIYYISNNDFKSFASLLIVFGFTFITDIVKKIFKLELSPLTIFLLILLIFSSIYLGKILNLYYTCWYFDVILHFLSGILFFDLGITLAKGKKIKYKYMVIFAICFSITVSTLWESLEYISDFFFNTDHQHWKFDINNLKYIDVGSTKQPGGLVDSMTDIICAVVGTLSMTIFTYVKSACNKKK